MKFFTIIIIMFLAVSCSNERTDSKATVKLFIKYYTEKNTEKIFEMLTPDSKRKYSKGNDQLIRTDFQANRYNVKLIRSRNRDKENKLHYMEILLKDGSAGFITLKEIDGKFYIKLD